MIQSVLKNLISTFGREVAEQPERIEAILRDLCPDSKKENRVLKCLPVSGYQKRWIRMKPYKSQESNPLKKGFTLNMALINN